MQTISGFKGEELMVSLNINLPENFLNEEVRCEYTITRKMKEVWAVELDLLNELDRVCKKHGIKYCADGGTLLGAVRHKGFIPWDDDVDVAMLRSEYEKLCIIAPNEFKEPYFFQTDETDPGSARGHAQLRNSQTTGILKSEIKMGCKFNQGIFIDIFPFDAVPEDQEELKNFYNLLCYKRKKLRSVLWNYSYFYPYIRKNKDGKICWREECKRFLKHIQYIITKPDYKIYYKDFEAECQKYNSIENLPMVADFCILAGLDRIQRYREDFEDLIEIDFEFLKIPVFRQYDRNLKRLYGENYMVPLKVKTEHGGVFFDTTESYRKYVFHDKNY